MKNIHRIKRLLPKDSPSTHSLVCIFHTLIGKNPTRRSVPLVKAYINEEITYEEIKKLLNLP